MNTVPESQYKESYNYGSLRELISLVPPSIEGTEFHRLMTYFHPKKLHNVPINTSELSDVGKYELEYVSFIPPYYPNRPTDSYSNQPHNCQNNCIDVSQYTDLRRITNCIESYPIVFFDKVENNIDGVIESFKHIEFLIINQCKQYKEINIPNVTNAIIISYDHPTYVKGSKKESLLLAPTHYCGRYGSLDQCKDPKYPGMICRGFSGYQCPTNYRTRNINGCYSTVPPDKIDKNNKDIELIKKNVKLSIYEFMMKIQQNAKKNDISSNDIKCVKFETNSDELILKNLRSLEELVIIGGTQVCRITMDVLPNLHKLRIDGRVEFPTDLFRYIPKIKSIDCIQTDDEEFRKQFQNVEFSNSYRERKNIEEEYQNMIEKLQQEKNNKLKKLLI